MPRRHRVDNAGTAGSAGSAGSAESAGAGKTTGSGCGSTLRRRLLLLTFSLLTSTWLVTGATWQTMTCNAGACDVETISVPLHLPLPLPILNATAAHDQYCTPAAPHLQTVPNPAQAAPAPIAGADAEADSCCQQTPPANQQAQTAQTEQTAHELGEHCCTTITKQAEAILQPAGPTTKTSSHDAHWLATLPPLHLLSHAWPLPSGDLLPITPRRAATASSAKTGASTPSHHRQLARRTGASDRATATVLLPQVI